MYHRLGGANGGAEVVIAEGAKAVGIGAADTGVGLIDIEATRKDIGVAENSLRVPFRVAVV